jgi:cytoskeletal protein CcmA (bactofilin family)
MNPKPSFWSRMRPLLTIETLFIVVVLGIAALGAIPSAQEALKPLPTQDPLILYGQPATPVGMAVVPLTFGTQPPFGGPPSISGVMPTQAFFIPTAAPMLPDSALIDGTLKVDADSGNCDGRRSFCSIASAIQAAAPGATIVLDDARYIENIVIDRDLTIAGNVDGSVMSGTGQPPIIIIGGANITLQNLVFQDMFSTGSISIYVRNTDYTLTIQDSTFQMGDGTLTTTSIVIDGGANSAISMSNVVFQNPTIAVDVVNGDGYSLDFADVAFQATQSGVRVQGGQNNVVRLGAGVEAYDATDVELVSGSNNTVERP